MPDQTDAKAIIETVERLGGAVPVALKRGNSEEVSAYLVPKGLELKSVRHLLDEYLTRPERRKGTAKLEDVKSFCAHVNRYKDDHSALFCFTDNQQTSQVLLAVLDYHEKDSQEAGVKGLPRFGEHRSRYGFPFSDEWLAWTGKNATAMPQAQFAEFLEDRIVDILAPSDAGPTAIEISKKIGCEFGKPSLLITLARGLQIHIDQKVANFVKLESGETKMLFEETSETKDAEGYSVSVPGAFLIGIPVFKRGTMYRIGVRLRYRKDRGSVVWWYEMFRTDFVREDAIVDICSEAAAETDLPLFRGRPEASKVED